MTTTDPSNRYHRILVGSSTETLDAALIIGRRPSSHRIERRGDPRLVTVRSPRNEVSATHVEIRQEGTAVVVTDLKSTNGTRVTIPGRLPVALRQGESIVVLVGTIVDIGDGNRLEVLPTTRSIPQEESIP